VLCFVVLWSCVVLCCVVELCCVVLCCGDVEKERNKLHSHRTFIKYEYSSTFRPYNVIIRLALEHYEMKKTNCINKNVIFQ
jgi:hypothetical protein